ncbi:MAG: MFS transporter, partial [candidate division WOR-3 bacterium]
MNHALQGLRRTFQALSYHDFRLFWIGQLISLTGTWMQSIAQSWLVLELTRSSFVLGMVSALGMLPVLFFALPAGAIADGVDKRRLLMVTQSAMMGLALILAVLTSTGNVRVWQIVALAVLLGLANAFDQPGRQAFVIELVGREDLLNAVALNSAAFNTARILGPALAGILIGTLGIAACFYLNGLSFVAVIVGLGLIRTSFTPERPAAESIFEDMLDGLKYIRQDRRILTLIVLVGVFSIFGLPYLVLMPVVARSVLKCG